MNNLLVILFVVFASSALAELASPGGPYPSSGWRPSGPEFRYPTSESSSYLPPSRPESRSFAQASVNFQLPQRSSRLQQSWNSQDDSTVQDTWSNRQPQTEFRSVTPQQQTFNPQPTNSFGTRIPRPQQPDAKISPDFSSSPSTSQGVSNSDQSSYLPPPTSQYRSQRLQQSNLFLSPPQEFRAIPYTEYGPPQQYNAAPAQQYGAPLTQEYGPPPSQEYGPPSTEPTTTEQPTTEAVPTTTEVEAETTTTELPAVVDARTEQLNANAIDSDERSQKLTANEEQGIYYVYHPSGLLQRIRYTTNDNQQSMEYSARLRYENVEPINGPIYTYDPQTYIFSRLN